MPAKHERLKQLQAFEYYYSLGPKRTLKDVAAKFGYSIPTVSSWSATFDWKNRVTERDKEVIQKQVEETDRQIWDDLREYRQIIKDTIDLYSAKLKINKIPTPTILDVVRLMNLDLNVSGVLDHGTINKIIGEDASNGNGGVNIYLDVNVPKEDDEDT